MQRGARLARRGLGAMPSSVGSKKHPKQLKNNGLGHFRETSFGGAMWTKSIPMQRGARFVLRRSAPMQRGAHLSI